MFTVEDYIEILTGMQKNPNEGVGFNIERSDYNLLTSLAKQTFKGMSYTDRQYELAKQKLLFYKDQFEKNNFKDITENFNNLRLPLRSIDRSRWMKIVDHPDNNVHESNKTHHWIAVRFIFNKTLISLIEAIRSTDKDAIYDKESKIHYFALSEKNIYNIMNALKDKNFDIADELKEKYETICEMVKNKNNYIPGIYGLKLRNLHDRALEYIISTVGEPDINNLALFKDRSELLSLQYFDDDMLSQSISQLTTLTQKVVKRKKNTVLVNKNVYNFDRIAETVLELNRFPLLIVLNPSTDYDDLVTTYSSFKNILFNEDFCVLYRKDNTSDDDKQFNQYITDNHLNNKLDNNPKVVYITNDKFPKTLLKSKWKPSSVIMLGSTRLTNNSKLYSYINEVDLVMHYDTDISPFMRDIEKI